tara:strand:- start:6847 stop:7059 length:213 start_codon:yes stop_codon:yes gene_type:complete
MCGCGGIGRHARFRFWWRKPWGFKSLHPHQDISVSLIRVNCETKHGIIIDCIGMIAFSIEVSVNKIGIRK